MAKTVTGAADSAKSSTARKIKPSPARRGAKHQRTTDCGAGAAYTPTGIHGLDQVLGGGLPTGRAMLVTGGAGSGKTLIGCEFLVRGITEYGEPGVLVTFEETAAELAANVAGFGWDFAALQDAGKLYPLTINLASGVGVETGEFDLEALFLRIGAGINKVGAKRIVLDGLNNLLSSFRDEQIIRSELLRLFRHLKERGLTIVATGERGTHSWSRLGFEEYLADGLIVLDNRIEGKVAKRVLRVVKCRGMRHETDEFPFLIGRDGISLFPIKAVQLDYDVTTDRVETGVAGLDGMLGGLGYYRGSTILVGGAAGTGKSSLGAAFVDAACRRGERAIYFAFEESASQIIRNMRSIGIDLERWHKKGLLTFYTTRAMHHGLEGHLTGMQEAVRVARPSVAVVDPISGLSSIGSELEIKSMLTRLVDHFRYLGVTTMINNLSTSGRSGEEADLAVSSMADTWILLRTVEHNAERNNVVQVLKSRGMSHSAVMREFNFTSDGIAVVDAYVGVNGVVIGSARHAQEAKDRMAQMEREAEIEAARHRLSERRRALDAQIAALEAEYRAEEEELKTRAKTLKKAVDVITEAVDGMAQERAGAPS